MKQITVLSKVNFLLESQTDAAQTAQGRVLQAEHGKLVPFGSDEVAEGKAQRMKNIDFYSQVHSLQRETYQ